MPMGQPLWLPPPCCLRQPLRLPPPCCLCREYSAWALTIPLTCPAFCYTNRPTRLYKNGEQVESPHSRTLSPLAKGGEGWGEGGFETRRIYKLCSGDWYYQANRNGSNIDLASKPVFFL
jgi:hypothetical protein